MINAPAQTTYMLGGKSPPNTALSTQMFQEQCKQLSQTQNELFPTQR